MTLLRIFQSRLKAGFRILALSKSLKQRRTVRQLLVSVFIVTLRTAADKDILPLGTDCAFR
jgi:hypothetical protein